MVSCIATETTDDTAAVVGGVDLTVVDTVDGSYGVILNVTEHTAGLVSSGQLTVVDAVGSQNLGAGCAVTDQSTGRLGAGDVDLADDIGKGCLAVGPSGYRTAVNNGVSNLVVGDVTDDGQVLDGARKVCEQRSGSSDGVTVTVEVAGEGDVLSVGCGDFLAAVPGSGNGDVVCQIVRAVSGHSGKLFCGGDGGSGCYVGVNTVVPLVNDTVIACSQSRSSVNTDALIEYGRADCLVKQVCNFTGCHLLCGDSHTLIGGYDISGNETCSDVILCQCVVIHRAFAVGCFVVKDER